MIAWANVQLMPDPTILSAETGTRHRTAERVSKQTTALVIAISERRDVVSLYVEERVHPPGHSRGAGQSESGPGDAGEVPRAARPGLAPADRARVRGRRRPPRRASVLQRAELVTRMAVEVERYIVERGPRAG